MPQSGHDDPEVAEILAELYSPLTDPVNAVPEHITVSSEIGG